MKVKDAMHRGVTWATPDTVVADLVTKMRDESIGSIPIGENDRLVGIVAQADIALGENEKKTGELVEAISEPSDGERR